MPNSPDGWYDRNVPGISPLDLKRPWETNESRLVTEALESAMFMPDNVVRMLPCPLPQVVLFPPRFGYARETPGIKEVMAVDGNTSESQAFSGGPGSYAGSSRNALGQGDG